MHQDGTGTGLGHDLGQGGITLETPDVVDQHGAGRESPSGHFGLGGVDRERHRQSVRERLDDRRDATPLLLGIDRREPRPGRLAPDVDDGGAGCLQGLPLRHGGEMRREPSAVRERVRRDVEDPHHGP